MAWFTGIVARGPMNEQPLILAADDEQDVLDLVEFRLSRAGYRVVTAPDGERALELAVDREPDLCVLDIMMPGIDGFEVTRRIRATAAIASTPVILLTASVQEAAVSKGYEAGANDYMRKPFSPQELLNRVETALER
jgi:DNA-binding response OmpR family regulator